MNQLQNDMFVLTEEWHIREVMYVYFSSVSVLWYNKKYVAV